MTGGQKAVGIGPFQARREPTNLGWPIQYPDEQIVVISVHFMSFNNFRHIKARKMLSIDKIGWFDDMGIKSMSVEFN